MNERQDTIQFHPTIPGIGALDLKACWETPFNVAAAVALMPRESPFRWMAHGSNWRGARSNT